MLRNCLKWEFEGNVLQRVGLFFYLLLFFSPMNNNFGHCMADLPGQIKERLIQLDKTRLKA